MHLMLPTLPLPPTCGQTDACENITLSQLRLSAVNIRQYPVVVVSEAILLVMAPKSVFTARKRSLRRLCFHRCLSVCPRGGVSAPLHDGIHTPSRHPLGTPPPGHTHPPAHTPPGTHSLPNPTPGHTPSLLGRQPPRQTPPPVL